MKKIEIFGIIAIVVCLFLGFSTQYAIAGDLDDAFDTDRCHDILSQGTFQTSRYR